MERLGYRADGWAGDPREGGVTREDQRRYTVRLVLLVRDLEEGQSVVFPHLTANHRRLIGAAKLLLNRAYVIRQVTTGWKVIRRAGSHTFHAKQKKIEESSTTSSALVVR